MRRSAREWWWTAKGGTAVLVVALLAAGCEPEPEESEGEPEPAAEEPDPGADPRALDYDPELGVDFERLEERDRGLFLEDRQEGDGDEAEEGTTVLVHYTGALPDGSVFDSSRDGEPFSFTLGAGEVIEGWEEGVRGMREGGVRLLVIPPQLAYGEQGAADVIPPGATLVFEVELVEVL